MEVVRGESGGASAATKGGEIDAKHAVYHTEVSTYVIDEESAQE